MVSLPDCAADAPRKSGCVQSRLILLCSMPYQHFLEDQERRIQTVIAPSSVAIRGLHPDAASLIAIFTNPNYVRATAKVIAELIVDEGQNVSDR
jgi:hypothetical protein